MRQAWRLAAIALWAAGAFAASEKEWVFPALVYGPRQWSLIKISNKSKKPARIHVEAYAQTGEPVEMAETVEPAPGSTVELRFQPENGGGFGWARIHVLKSEADGIQVEVVTEYLVGNQIRWVPREKAEVSVEWTRMALPQPNSYLYLLNTSDKALHAKICWTDRRADRSCTFSNGKTAKAIVRAKQALFIALGKPQGQYLATAFDELLPTAMMFFDQTAGSAKTFSTESTLTFDGDDPASDSDSKP